MKLEWPMLTSTGPWLELRPMVTDCCRIRYSVLPYGFFKRLGIPGPRPIPFLGTFLQYRKGLFNFDVECYKKYGNIWGIYDGRKPIVCIMDPEMIKAILVKEFYTLFTNRRDFGLNGPLDESILIVKDEKWKRIRNVLSPTFTSGRLKEMFSIIKHYTQNLLALAERKAKLNEAVEMKDFFGSYSMDGVVSTSFSVDINSINNPKDQFVINGKIIGEFSFFNPALILILIFPILTSVMSKLEFSFFPKAVSDFFMRNLESIKRKRKEGKHKDRVDFLQLMIDSQESSMKRKQNDGNDPTCKALTDSEILSQGITFIFAGYETTSNTLLYMAHNLAMHPDVQKKLQQEIDTAFPNKAPITYDDVMQLEYLEMVISETLRLYPPAPRLERVCKEDVILNGVTIPKDTVVVVPAYVLHRDPKYWAEPEEFRPERFRKEERESRNPCIFLPFGMGPRNCIGMRFAQLLMKMAIASILQHLTIVPCDETQAFPLEIDFKGSMRPKNPIFLKFVPRRDADAKD
ncbi:cytochrome P450 3A30-like isoform X2 [Narcine bancroftii]|uniref:cytochrome P450 3A30-like isoform X2 n=1 Tax=Narcine bancroftii TaxID=1343680 RepID=UPI003831A275